MGIKTYAEIIGIVAIVKRYIENTVMIVYSMKYVFCNDTHRLWHAKIL